MNALIGLSSYTFLSHAVRNILAKITSIKPLESPPVLLLSLWIASQRNNMHAKHIFLRNAIVGGALYGIYGLGIYPFPTGGMLITDILHGAAEATLLTGLFKYVFYNIRSADDKN